MHGWGIKTSSSTRKQKLNHGNFCLIINSGGLCSFFFVHCFFHSKSDKQNHLYVYGIVHP